MANKLLKTLEIGGTPFDVAQVTGVKGDAETDYRTGDVNITPANLGISQTFSGTEDISTSDVTTYTTAAKSLAKGTYIVVGRGIFQAGSGTGSCRYSATLNVGTGSVLCMRMRLTPNNEQADLPFCHSFVLTATSNVSVRVTSSVAKKIGARWNVIKIA